MLKQPDATPSAEQLFELLDGFVSQFVSVDSIGLMGSLQTTATRFTSLACIARPIAVHFKFNLINLVD